MRYDRQTATTWLHYERFSPAERLFLLPFASLSRLFSLFPASLGLPFLASCRLIRARAFTHETFQTRQYVMFEARALRHPCLASGRSTWNRRFFPILYISVDASSIPRPNSRPCKYMTLDARIDMIMSKYFRVVR